MSQPKKKASQTDLIPYSAGEPVAIIALERIDTAPQARTEFDEESLQELAEDIKARGVLQPIIVRQVEEGRFLVIAGERRFRASILAGQATIPALLREANDEEAQGLQLAENIQREELSLEDTANAVRMLFDREKSLAKVATMVKKSKPWVSKHLALTLDDMPYVALNLLRQGITEDMEIINLVAKVARECGPHEAMEMSSKIRASEMNRTQARAFAKEAKARKEEEEKALAREEEGGEAPVSHAKRRETREQRPSAWGVWSKIEGLMDEYRQEQGVPFYSSIAGALSEKETEVFMEDLQSGYDEGRDIAKDQVNFVSRLLILGSEIGYREQEAAAAVIGFKGQELSLVNIIQEVHLDRERRGE